MWLPISVALFPQQCARPAVSIPQARKVPAATSLYVPAGGGRFPADCEDAGQQASAPVVVTVHVSVTPTATRVNLVSIGMLLVGPLMGAGHAGAPTAWSQQRTVPEVLGSTEMPHA